MKMRMLALLLTVLMVTGLLTACGGSASSEAYDNAAPREEAKAEEPAAGEYGADGVLNSSSGTNQSATEQKLIKRVNIDAETEDLQALLPQITNKIGELGGYIESQELYNGSKFSTNRSRNVRMTVRIPAARLGEFTGQVEGLSNVTSYTETAEDVTLQYVDTESRVKALQVEQERLLELLAKAEDMDVLLKIEDRLTDVRYELERYASQLRALDNKVDYATVYLYIAQVKVYTEPEPVTVWQRISSGFSGNLRDIGESLTNFFVWVTVYSPQLIFWAVVIAVAVTVIRRRTRKIRVSRAPVKREDGEEKA